MHPIVTPRRRVDRIRTVVRDYLCADPMTPGKGSGRTVKARWLAFYLTKELTDHSPNKIGRLYNRDHSTVLYGIRKVKEAAERNPKIRGTLAFLQRRAAAE